MKKVFIAIVSLFVICSCGGSKEKKDGARKDFADMFELSDYVYIDNSRCLHVSKDCYVLTFGDEDGEKPNYQVKFVATKELTQNDFNSMCSKCVSTKSFRKLRNIIDSNNILNIGYEEENDSAM